MRKALLFSFLLLLPISALAPAFALSPSPYVTPQQVELAHLIAPSPAPNSDAQKKDMDGVLQAQKTRSAEQAAKAESDAVVSVFTFKDVLGEKFTAQNFPKTAAFFTKVVNEGAAIVNVAKDYWKRPRPFVVSNEVNALPKAKAGVLNNGAASFSYPSGHSTAGALYAIFLSEMLPEKRDVLFQRGWSYGWNRVVAGVHYPTDVEMGRIDATVIANAMRQNPVFAADLAEARQELRAGLNMPPETP